MFSKGAKNIGKLREEWEKRLHCFAYSYVHSQVVAEDMVQDVFLKILEANIDLSKYDNIGSLLYTILKNKCLDYIKHREVEAKHMQDVEEMHYLVASKYALEDESVRIITNNEIQKVLRASIDSLPPRTKEIFILSKFRGKTYNEIANIYGITPKSVEYQISKAMSILKEKMGGYYIIIPFISLFQ